MLYLARHLLHCGPFLPVVAAPRGAPLIERARAEGIETVELPGRAEWRPGNFAAVNRLLREGRQVHILVITSYSIHYTKLYDVIVVHAEVDEPRRPFNEAVGDGAPEAAVVGVVAVVAHHEVVSVGDPDRTEIEDRLRKLAVVDDRRA